MSQTTNEEARAMALHLAMEFVLMRSQLGMGPMSAQIDDGLSILAVAENFYQFIIKQNEQ